MILYVYIFIYRASACGEHSCRGAVQTIRNGGNDENKIFEYYDRRFRAVGFNVGYDYHVY
jgi:hypothetical protein